MLTDIFQNLNQIKCSIIHFLFSSTRGTKHSWGSKLGLIGTYIFACFSRWNIEKGTILHLNKFGAPGIGILKFSVMLCFFDSIMQIF